MLEHPRPFKLSRFKLIWNHLYWCFHIFHFCQDLQLSHKRLVSLLIITATFLARGQVWNYFCLFLKILWRRTYFDIFKCSSFVVGIGYNDCHSNYLFIHKFIAHFHFRFLLFNSDKIFKIIEKLQYLKYDNKIKLNLLR